MSNFFDLAAERYSERAFDSSRPVPAELVDKLLEVANLAPTARNSQSWYIYVLESEQALALANECTPCIYGAPLVMLICYDLTRMASIDTTEVNFGLVDSSIVASHIMLAATELGLASCWVGKFDERKTCMLFDLPEIIEPACFLPIGYPTAGPSERHSQRLPLEQLYERR